MVADAPEAVLKRARTLLRDRDIAGVTALLSPLAATSAEASFLLAAALAEGKDLQGARDVLHASFARQPAQVPLHHYLYAQVLHDVGDAAGAEAQARIALTGVPNWPNALHLQGLALRALGREDDAIAALRAAAEGAVVHKPAHRPLARLLHGRAMVGDALTHYRAALAHDDRDPDLWNEYGVALTDAGDLDAAREAYRKALARKPDYAEVESNLLVNLHYDPSIGAQVMFDAHRDWARRHAQGLPRVAIAPRSGALPRVGFLSPAFTAGPTATFLAPLLEHLTGFDRVGYNVGRQDAASRVLADRCDAFHELWMATDEDVARRIADDGIDVLVDLAGHTPGGRPRVLARKPAPRIATWLDYFDTTGLEAVDVLLADDISVPEGGAQRFTERVVSLGPARLCYGPPQGAPAVGPTPALARGHVTFGSFNRLSKIPPPVIEAWAAVLLAVPGSRLVVKNNALQDAAMRDRLAAAFARRGIAGDRLDLRGPSPHAAMLAEYGDIDISLDTFPYNGGLTTCEALWMGVPVVTVLGEAMISRQSAALLHAAGLDDDVATDAGGYVVRAATLARDPRALAARRKAQRERLRASPLLDGAGFARRFATALHAIVGA